MKSTLFFSLAALLIVTLPACKKPVRKQVEEEKVTVTRSVEKTSEKSTSGKI